jgi:hypothetical protein
MSIYLEVYDAEPTRRIELIRTRVKRSSVRALAKSLGVHEAALFADLGMRSGKSERVKQAPSEPILGLMSLIGRMEKMVGSSGSIDFDAAKWLGVWLNVPLPALRGARSGSFLDTMAGQELLGSLIAMAESGAYA